MNVFFATLGCRLNEAEIEAWTRGFAAAGHRVVGAPAQADLVVLNSCAVTAEAARKTRKLCRRLRRHNPEARLVLAGCFGAVHPREAADLAEHGLVVAHSADKDRLLEVVDRHLAHAAGAETGAIRDPAVDGARRRRTRAFVKVQDGCGNRCTYCVVALARGEERSRPMREVVEEVARLEAEGRKEVVLTGARLGGYGADQGTDLAALVRALLDQTGIPRLRLSSVEPWDLTADFFALFADARLCPHLHLPLQSGSDAVLHRMGRRCDRAGYRGLVEQARATIADLRITSDVIVGFPGESDAEFEETVAFVEEIGFAGLHIFAYSPRPGTAAARMSGRVPDRVKHQRSRRLHGIAASMGRASLGGMVGTARPVLWEGRSEALGDGRGRWEGLTDNYARVEVVATAGTDLENCIATTLLVAIEGNRLRGQLLPSPA